MSDASGRERRERNATVKRLQAELVASPQPGKLGKPRNPSLLPVRERRQTTDHSDLIRKCDGAWEDRPTGSPCEGHHILPMPRPRRIQAQLGHPAADPLG